MPESKAALWAQIRDELRYVSSDWGDDFRFELTEDDFDEEEQELRVSVDVTNKYFPDMCYTFCVKAKEDDTQIEMGEDSFYELNGKHFFAFMFFESEQKRRDEVAKGSH